MSGTRLLRIFARTSRITQYKLQFFSGADVIRFRNNVTCSYGVKPSRPCLGALLADVGGVQYTPSSKDLTDTDLGNGSRKDLDHVDSHSWIIERNG
jgi:hypothetical protein